MIGRVGVDLDERFSHVRIARRLQRSDPQLRRNLVRFEVVCNDNVFVQCVVSWLEQTAAQSLEFERSGEVQFKRTLRSLQLRPQNAG